MPSRQHPYGSTDWVVIPGNEDRFIEAWDALAQWTGEHLHPRTTILLRNDHHPNKFRSFLSWGHDSKRENSVPIGHGAELFEVCSRLCESVENHRYTSVSSLYGG